MWSRFIVFSLFLILIISVAGKQKRFKQPKVQEKQLLETSLKAVIENGRVYVDKTDLILQLIESDNRRVFISRPKKFGKSFLLDTIREIFLGNKELFQGRKIYSTDYDWKKYPILSFDFSEFYNRHVNAPKLQMAIEKEIRRFGNASQIPEKETNFHERLQYYLEYVQNNGTVVLIDEYDLPFVVTKSDPKITQECQTILRAVFHVLKEAQIRFMIVTGISTTAFTSICDYKDEIRDITMDPTYSTLLGYTETEYRTNFDTHFKEIVEFRNVSEDVIRNEIQFLYNGYRFSEKNDTVHNPFSLTKYLYTNETKNYFIDLETPNFVIDQIWRRFREAISLSLRSTIESRVLRMHYDDFDNIPLISLLYRTGYLTIKEHHPERNVYEIDFPNEEVRETFIRCLMKEFGAIGWESMMEQREVVQQNLKYVEISDFIDNFQLEFHRMLGILAKLGKEDAFGFIFRIVLSLCTEKSVEIKDLPLPLGRSDFMSILPNVFYVFELQMLPGYDFTMSEAEVMKYRKKYGTGCTKTIAFKLSFNHKTCLIEKWQATEYADEKKITDYSPTITSDGPNDGRNS